MASCKGVCCVLLHASIGRRKKGDVKNKVDSKTLKIKKQDKGRKKKEETFETEVYRLLEHLESDVLGTEHLPVNIQFVHHYNCLSSFFHILFPDLEKKFPSVWDLLRKLVIQAVVEFLSDFFQ